MNDDERRQLGEAIKDARTARGWGKEEAARQAGINSITWKRAEDGLRVQDHKLRAIQTALGWDTPDAARFDSAFGRTMQVAASAPVLNRTLSTELDPLFVSASMFVNRAQQYGASKNLGSVIQRGLIELLDQARDAVGKAGITPPIAEGLGPQDVLTEILVRGLASSPGLAERFADMTEEIVRARSAREDRPGDESQDGPEGQS